MWKQLLLIGFLAIQSLISEEIKSEFQRSFARNCDTSYSFTCLKLDVVSWVDKLNEDDNYNIVPGVSIVRENDSSSASTADIVSNLAKEFPNDPEARLDVFLMKKVAGFFNNHAIKVKMFGDSDNAEVATARKKDKGGGGGMGYLLAAGAMMKGMMMSMALAALAAMAGKALMAALASLLLSAIAALKGSGGGGGGKTTYEVIAKPVYTSSHSQSQAHEDYGGHGGHSGYGRSFSERQLPLGLQPEYKPDH